MYDFVNTADDGDWFMWVFLTVTVSKMMDLVGQVIL